jgi:uncharacterized protein YchJ
MVSKHKKITFSESTRLTKKQKTELYNKTFNQTLELGLKHLKIVSRIYKDTSLENQYISKTLSEVWELLKDASAWVNSSNEKYLYYLVRTALEHSLKIEWFIKQDDRRREAVAVTQVIKILDSNEPYITETLGYSAIKAEKEKIQKSRQYKTPNSLNFPTTKDLINKSQLGKKDNLQLIWQRLSQQDHGNLLDIIARKEHSENTSNIGMLTFVGRYVARLQTLIINKPLKTQELTTLEDIVKSNWYEMIDDFIPKNKQGRRLRHFDPCHCGSGKKYKKCHGA